MSVSTIFDAINAQLATLENLNESQVAWLGTTFTPEAGTPYIATSMPVLTSRMITTGPTGINQISGIYQVNCAFPVGIGLEDVLNQVDAVRALFPNALTLTTSDTYFVKFFGPDVKPPVPSGAWIHGIVRCPWLCHEVSL